jgi:polyphosphate kinase
LEVIFDDQNRLIHVRVTWAYDDFYSLLILEELQLDQDADNNLTPEESRRLTGFDMNWVPGFTGDLDVRLGGQALKLSGPLEPTAELRDGRIVTSHLREVTGQPAMLGETLSLRAYDESFYTSYDLTLPVRVSGGNTCMTDRVDPDIDQKLRDMQAFLLTLDANADLEENDIPMIGAEFATEIRITCPNS